MPNGEIVDVDLGTALAAWSEVAKPVEALTGWELEACDPTLRFYDKEHGCTHVVSVHLAQRIGDMAARLAAAEKERDAARADLADALAERDGFQSIATQSCRERDEARREGAEAMREACYSAVEDDYYWKFITAIDVSKLPPWKPST